jgi:hypothetical protein
MIILFALQVTRVLAGDPSQGTDHVEQVAVVAQFLATPENARISATVEINNLDDRSKNSMLAFKAYASECPIDKISAIPSARKPLPVGVRWDCLRYVEIDGKTEWEERNASFWVTDGVITKISFGKPPTISIPEVRKAIDTRTQKSLVDPR